MIDKIRNFYYGVRNLIKWFPIIWKDRDWDYVYLLKIMSFKMENMAHLQEKYGSSSDSGECATQLTICAGIAEKIANDNYEFVKLNKYEEEINKDIELLFDGMKQHIRKWWD